MERNQSLPYCAYVESPYPPYWHCHDSSIYGPGMSTSSVPYPPNSTLEESTGAPEEPERVANTEKNSLGFNYRVKIINPGKRSDFMIREIYNYRDKFESITAMKLKLMDDFPGQVPSTMDFQIGYFMGRQSAKYWLMCQADLDSMYKSLNGKQSLLLWCDGKTTEAISGETSTKSRKRKSASPVHHTSKRQAMEEEVDETVSELKKKHGSKYSLPQLRLWGRMIAAGNHESTDDPPQIPAITGITPKRDKKESLASAIAGAAATFATALRTPQIQQTSVSAPNSVVMTTESPPVTPKSNRHSSDKPTPAGLSPGRISELRIKKLQELRELQHLLEENVLTTEEFVEQKGLVLGSLRKLTH